MNLERHSSGVSGCAREKWKLCVGVHGVLIALSAAVIRHFNLSFRHFTRLAKLGRKPFIVSKIQTLYLPTLLKESYHKLGKSELKRMVVMGTIIRRSDSI